jgi:hypothetical protein
MRSRYGILAAVIGIAALPLLGDRIRRKTEHCAMDGVAVAAAYRVRIEVEYGTHDVFCGVSCADRWLRLRRETPRRVLVTDCVTGSACPADQATFVRSFDGAAENAPDPIRVFARRSEAQRHVDAYGGTILQDAMRPLQIHGRP